MLARILPLSILILIGSGFAYIFLNKEKFKLEWNKNINIALASTLLSLHLFSVYLIAIYHSAYMYFLHTDICTMLYPWITVSLLLNKKNWVKPILPWAIVGGFLQIATETTDNFYADRLDFVLTLIKHIILLVLALWVAFTIDSYVKKDIRNSFIWVFSFMFYVFVVVIIPQLITGNEKLGIFSFALSPSTYKVIDAAWRSDKVFNQALYKVLNFVGYPYGTLLLYLVGSGLSLLTSVGVISLKKSLSNNIEIVKVL